jgi:hypothetical protein
MSTANDFWREREGGNLWSRWLSFSCPHICIHVLNILTNILFEFTSALYMFIDVLSILNILFTYDTVTFGFLSGREWPQKKTNLWISSRDTNFLTVFMTSYFCDVILTPSLWRHIFVTSFWRRHYDVIFLWRHFDAVIMTSYFCDVILTQSLWRHIFVTSFWRRHYDVILKMTHKTVAKTCSWRFCFSL